MNREPDGFLNRWSSRKQAARDEDVEPVQETVTEPTSEDVSEKSDAQILEELGLKDPDDMAPGDDFSAFMATGIPERLRNRALRKLWLTNPVLANLDELVEYGEDYTDAAMVVENLQTAYRVGKGFLRQEEIDADKAEVEVADSTAEKEEDDSEVEPEPADNQVTSDADESERLDAVADTDPDAIESHPFEPSDSVIVTESLRTDVAEQPALPRRSRRMVFRVEEG